MFVLSPVFTLWREVVGVIPGVTPGVVPGVVPGVISGVCVGVGVGVGVVVVTVLVIVTVSSFSPSNVRLPSPLTLYPNVSEIRGLLIQ